MLLESFVPVKWGSKDLSVVFLGVCAGFTACYIGVHSVLSNETIAFNLVHYAASLLQLALPLLWVTKKLKVPKEALGLTHGKLSWMLHILIGVSAATVYFLVFLGLARCCHLHPFLVYAKQKPYSPLQSILLPVSLGALPTTVLAPIAEEVMFRGFTYGYLRTKIGVAGGLVLQAVLFGLTHFNMNTSVYSALAIIVAGMLFGLLYEKTGSLYPSMICHGAINYFWIIGAATQKL